ncbi:MAG: hypothetical protein WEA82_09965 [Idiomarina sp.]
MKNESLEKFIDIYNSGVWLVPMSSYKISSDVEVAKVWDKFPTGKLCNEESYRFFFITNDIECVAIVLDMEGSDIHWFVAEKHRKQGYLYKALKDSIFPYLFDDGRKEQRATADNSENEAYLMRQGFKRRTEGVEVAYYLNANDVSKYDKSQLCRISLSSDELEAIKFELRRVSGEIRIIRDKLECANGEDHGLNNIACDLCNFAHDVEFYFQKT